ncbi:MAG: hypothetical protein ABIX28_01710 [Vicinamibacterales bacterium]
MTALRLYDPDRRPPNYTDLIQPHQFVVFASEAETGSPVEADGRPFPSAEETTCLVFEALAEARSFCTDRVAEHESVRFEVFDGRGRIDEPLLLIVSPARASRLEGSRQMIRLRTRIAILLFVAGPPLIYYDYRVSGGSLVLPTFLGISMILAALRLLFMNRGVRDAEHRRQERLKEYE